MVMTTPTINQTAIMIRIRWLADVQFKRSAFPQPSTISRLDRSQCGSDMFHEPQRETDWACHGRDELVALALRWRMQACIANATTGIRGQYRRAH